MARLATRTPGLDTTARRATQDYEDGLAAARAGEPRNPEASAWWRYGWDVADDAIQLDAFFDARAVG